jgi:hypothetical protein
MLHNMSLIRFILTVVTSIVFSIFFISLTKTIYYPISDMKNTILIYYIFTECFLIFFIIFLSLIIISYNIRIQKILRKASKVIYGIKYWGKYLKVSI